MQLLLDKGIATRRGVMCIHKEPAYAQKQWRTVDADVSRATLVNSVDAQKQSILLPLHHQIEIENQDYICKVLRALLNKKN